MSYGRSAEIASQIHNHSALAVIVEPVFEIMQPRKIFAGANAAAVTIELDVTKQRLGFPIFLSSFNIRANPSESSKNVQQSTP